MRHTEKHDKSDRFSRVYKKVSTDSVFIVIILDVIFE